MEVKMQIKGKDGNMPVAHLRDGSLYSLALEPTVQRLSSDEKQAVRAQTPERRYHISTVTISAPESIGNVSAIRLNAEDEGSVRISIGADSPTTKTVDDMVHNWSAFALSSPNMVMSSGQCSPSDTLDSGTCSDLDGTPPPLPKKTKTKKSVSVTLIQSQNDSEDNESNISCDSLNSSELNNAEDSSKTNFIPKSLLQDIRQRSSKLITTVKEETPDVWGKPQRNDELTSFKLVSKIVSNNANKIKKDEENLNSLPLNLECLSIPKPPVIKEITYAERQEEKNHFSGSFMYESDKYYKFHLNEKFVEEPKRSVVNKVKSDRIDEESVEYFAGFKDYKSDLAPAAIRSAKGTIRGVKNRVRAGIATFLQMQNKTVKSYKEKDAGKVVVYTTTMGIVRGTYQRCMQVKKILRTLLVKFEERDVFMSGEYQDEIRDRMMSEDILVPQLFVDGNHVGDADTVERLNESGELRKMLKPYKSADACSTCQTCGGYRLLPCPICCGSKKSLHRNDFTAEFVALKCMNCDEVGLVKCSTCS